MHKVKTDEIIGYLKRGLPVLTVNARLSRCIRGEYDSHMQKTGVSLWQSPLIIPLSSWFEYLWNESWMEAPLLDPVRSKALWEKIVSEDKDLSEDILLLSGAASTSYEAYSTLKEYNLSLPKDEVYLTEEAKALRRWVRLYEEEVKRLGFVESLTLKERLAKLIEDGRIKIPDAVVLAGFDELTPANARFLGLLKNRGADIIFWPYGPGENTGDIPDLNGRVNIRRYADEVEEVIQAARWARMMVRPGVKIGFIVPELSRYREIIKREFAAELDPASISPQGDRRDVFNISLGSPLSEEPLVRSALDILSLTEGKEDIAKVSPILLSPYFAGEDYITLSRLDAWIKKRNILTVSLNEIREGVKRSGDSRVLKEKLEVWITHLRGTGKKELPGFWAHNFSLLLKGLGWPSVKLSSGEYQALKAWNNLLEGFASLDEITGRIKRAEAVGKIASMARGAIHQRETEDSPIQVLGLLESAGMYFDHVWLMGCHEYALPAEPSPNPFIPLFLQKAHNIPHSSHGRELSFAKTALKRVFNSAPSFEVSFPLAADKRELQLSPLFKGLGKVMDGLRVEESSRLKDSIHSIRSLEDMPEDGNLPVGEDELKRLSGGTLIIKNQSLCPFKAFATHRLYAAAVATPELGLNESERGRLLHTALRFFWEKVEDSKRLREIMEKGELEGYIAGLTEKVFKEVDVAPLSSRFIEIERQRLTELFRQWAQVESKRGGFRVKVVEMEKTITIKGLAVSGRVDRVDITEEGHEVIIDYKSGEADRYDWLTSRPKDPQLIIYSLSEDYEAISFARVAPGECRFVGISRSDSVLPGVKSFDADSNFKKKAGAGDWAGLKDFWRSALENLTEEFLSGVAAVDPNGDLKGQDSPCRHCELTVLCRVTGLGYRSEEDDNG